MSYERTDLMEPYELQLYQMTKLRNEELKDKWKALVTEEELAFCNELDENHRKRAGACVER